MNESKRVPVTSNSIKTNHIRRLIASFIAFVAAIALVGVNVAHASPEEEPKVLSITPITEIYTFGQKVSAIAVEYSETVDANRIALDTYRVSDRNYVFRFDEVDKMGEMADRTITAVYTNAEPSKTSSQQSAFGNFVIIELDPDDWGGNTVLRSTCEGFLCYEKIDEQLRTTITHLQPVYGADSDSVLASADNVDRPMTNAPINQVADDFIYETFHTEAGMSVPYAYFLPDNYDADASYPMVVMLHGWGSGSNGVNEGVQVAVDKAVSSWLDPQVTGTNEDVIVLAPQTPRGESAEEAEATVELIDSFTNSHAVDEDRMAVATFSWGSTLAWHAMAEYPDLFDAALIISGFPVTEAQAATIAGASIPIWIAHATSDPVLPLALGQQSFATLREAYLATGLASDEVNELVRFTEFGDTAFAIPDYHAATGPVFSDAEIPSWIMSQLARPTTGEILGIQPVTEVSSYGQRVMKVIVEFSGPVDSASLSVKDFSVQDSEYNFRFQGIEDLENLIDRPVVDVYTTDDPSRVLTETRPEAVGNYVVLSIDPKADGGWTVIVSQCPTFLCSVRINPEQLTQVAVTGDVRGEDGSLLVAKEPSLYHPLTEPAVDRDTDQFQHSALATSTGELKYSYRLPPNYDPNKTYPLVIALPGHGMGFDGQNIGVQLAADRLATVWLNPAVTGNNDEVIVLAPQNERVGKEAEGAQTIELVEAFVAQYSVNPDRIYAASVSYGSQLMWEMFSTRPDLFAAGLLTGGFPADEEELPLIAGAAIPMWITHGTNDHLLKVDNARASFDSLVAAYEAQGMDSEQIAQLAIWTEYANEAFTLPDYHLAAAPTLDDIEPARWLLSQSKASDEAPQPKPDGEESADPTPADSENSREKTEEKLATTGFANAWVGVAALAMLLLGIGLVTIRRKSH